MQAAEFVAKYFIYIIPFLLLYYILEHDSHKRPSIEAFLIVLGGCIGFLLSNLIKNILRIPRPNIATDTLFWNEGIYSFPSGHTTFFFTLATIMFFYHRKISYILFILGALVGYSRIVIGVHYPVDIFGGAMLGIIVGLVLHNMKRKFWKF